MEYNVGNISETDGFLILGFTDSTDLKIPLLFMFLFIYLFTVMGNLLIIVLFSSDSRLKRPMYFFLCNMSFLDISYSSVTVPYLLHVLITGNKYIQFRMCMVQLYFFNSFAAMEFLLLTTMAYDRYMAICQPLSYPQLMNQRACMLLAVSAWLVGFIAGAPVTILSSTLTYCSSNIINHYFCDITAILKLACDDTSAVEFVIFAQGVVLLLSCFILTVTSYVYILSAVLKISSTEGRYKTFSTCGSHLTMVNLFYILLVFVYMKPTSSYSLDEGKFVSVLYVNVLPMLNPVVYSLRNADVKRALMRTCRRNVVNISF